LLARLKDAGVANAARVGTVVQTHPAGQLLIR